MPIPFRCPHCGTQTNVDDQYAGQTGPCASCGQAVTIPAPFGGAPPTAYAPPKSSGSSLVVILAIVGGLLVLAVPVIGVLVALLLPAMSGAGGAARRAQCSNNLKQIGLALHNYHDTYKCFPPAVITDEEGNPRRSWRVAILPYLDQAYLYEQWDSNEAWDGPNNSILRYTSIPTYRCPSDSGGDPLETSYVMITGQLDSDGRLCTTIGGQPNEGTRIANIVDGTSNTVIVVEVVNSGIPWSEPRDLSIEELEMLINGPSQAGIGSLHPGGAQVLMADGSVRFLTEDVTAETLRNMLLRDDGNPVVIPY